MRDNQSNTLESKCLSAVTDENCLLETLWVRRLFGGSQVMEKHT